MNKRMIFVAVSILMILSITSFALPPKLINFQGKLSTSGGAPVTGSRSVTFRIYDAVSGGTLLWSESDNVSMDAQGIFSTLLGNVAPLNLNFSVPMWVEIEYGGETFSPRQQFASVPYALYAISTESTSGGGGGISTAEADTKYVFKAGDTMSGTLTTESVMLNNNYLYWKTDGTHFSRYDVSGGYFESIHPNILLISNSNSTFDIGFGYDYVNAPTYAEIWHVKTGGSYSSIRVKDGLIDINSHSTDTDTKIQGDADANLLYVDAGNDRIGIGTNDPANRLDVEGAAAIGATYSGVNTAPSNGLVIEGSVGIGTFEPTSKLTVNGTIETKGNGGIRFADGTTQITAAGGGNFVSKTGDTMTGTLTIDAANLKVKGKLIVGDSSTQAPGAYAAAIGPQAYSTGAASIAMGDSSSAMNDGSVAIGNSAVSDDLNGIAIGHMTTAGGTYGGSIAIGEECSSYGGFSLATGYRSVANGPMSVAIGEKVTASGDDSVAMGQEMTVMGNDSFGIGLGSATKKIYQSNLFAVVGGKIGLGTTEVGTDKVVVYDTGDVNLTLRSVNGYSSLNVVGSSGIMGGIWQNVGDDKIRLWNNNVDMLVLDPYGNVGIGTDSPSASLEVRGGLIVTGVITGDGSGLTNLPAGSGGWTDNGSNITLTDQADTVAIGSSYSRGVLEVIGSNEAGDVEALVLRNRAHYSGAETGDSTSLIFVNSGHPSALHAGIRALTVAPNDVDLLFLTTSGGWSEKARMTYSGKWGIGTATVNNTLEVKGNMAVGAAYAGTYTAPDNGLIVEGNVGIGTNNPTASLDINGGLKVAGIITGDGSGLTNLPAAYDNTLAIGTTEAISGVTTHILGTPGSIPLMLDATGSDPVLAWGVDGVTKIELFYNRSNNFLELYNHSGTPQAILRVYDTGKIGVGTGTTPPASLFTVGGKLSATNIAAGTTEAFVALKVVGSAEISGDAKISNDMLVQGTLDTSANAQMPKIYSQASSPDIPNNTWAFWYDSDGAAMHLVLDSGGAQYITTMEAQ